MHQFVKPNDKRALNCMIESAKFVMDDVQDITLAFGESDEFRWGLFAVSFIVFYLNSFK